MRRSDLAANALTILSVVVLASAVHLTIAPSVCDTRAAQPAEVVLTIASAEVETGGGVAVTRMFADGLDVRTPDLTLGPGWHDRSSGPPTFWIDQWSGSGAARLRAPARAVVLEARPGAAGDVLRARVGDAVVERDLGRTGAIRIDVPAVRRPWWVFAIALLGLGALAHRIGPVRAGRVPTAWLASYLVILHACYWACTPTTTTSDSFAYMLSTEEFATGVVSYFPPGYGAFLLACQALAGDSAALVATAIQHAMLVASVIALFSMARTAMPGWLAYAAGLLAGTLGPSLLAPQSIMSETFATFCMAMALWLVWQSHAGSARAILAGLALGAGALARVVPLAAAAPAMALVCLLPHRERRWRTLLLALTVAGATVAGPVIWTGSRSGSYQLSNSTWLHLYNHVVHEQKLLDPGGQATQTLSTGIGADPREFDHWAVRQRWVARGGEGNYLQRVMLLGAVTREAARTASPLEHLVFTTALTWRNLFANAHDMMPTHAWTAERVAAIENAPLLRQTAAVRAAIDALGAAHGVLWPLLCWAMLAGLPLALLLPNRWTLLAIAWLAIGYLGATSCVEFFLERYNAAVTPFVVFAAATPLAATARWLARRRAAPTPTRAAAAC